MKKQNKNRKGMRCPYCSAPVHFRSATGIYRENSNDVMLYVCSNYPECDAYVRTHAGTKKPVGTLANGKLRALRKEAHDAFNQVYTTGAMTRDDAYRWLSAVLQSPPSQAHIGNLGEYYCRLVIEESQKFMQNRKGAKIYVFKIDDTTENTG